MTSPIDRGFHPLQRLVRRLSKISPHRQIQLLFAISVVTVGVMVAAVLGSLAPTRDSLTASNTTLVPALEQLDRARAAFNSASSSLPLVLDPDPAVQTEGLNRLTTGNSVGEAAFKEFQKKSANLPGERELERSFELNRRAAVLSGAAFLSEPVPTAEGLAEVAKFSSNLLDDLNRLKALYQTRVLHSLADARSNVDSTGRQIVVISAGALVVLLISFGVALRSARSREERLKALDRTLHEDSERNELEARLQRSFDMVHTEPDAYGLVARALSLTAPQTPAELLVADSGRAHFHQAVSTDEHAGPGCAVMSPGDCPAATWGQTQVWSSSTALDACPHLQGRLEGECSAVCVPVSVGGKTVSVVHATAPDQKPPDAQVVARVEMIARKLGERVAMLRAFKRSETQAHTDPLTGLMNRRSLEEKVRGLSEEGHTYVAAYGDLDHFKQLNDVYGHDAGDQALRLFARVLRDTVRPNDLTARYGGEEFVVVLPDCGVSDAYAVINRLRETLAVSQSSLSVAPFTVSFGITAARPENTFSQTLEIADAALLKAKSTGRDRIVISAEDVAPAPPAVNETAHPELSV